MSARFDFPDKATLLLAVAACATAWIMAWFIPPLIWSIYAAIAAWPLFQALRRRAHGHGKFLRNNLHVFAASCVLLVGVLLGAVATQSVIDEAGQLLSPQTVAMAQASIQDLGILDKIHGIPLIGAPLSRFAHEASFERFIEVHNLGSLLSEGTLIGGAVFAWVASFVFFAIAFGYLLRNGEELARKLDFASAKIFGEAFSNHLSHQATLIRSMFSSIVVLGIVETLLFWGAFSCAGVKQAVLYAAIVGATSMIPMLPSFLAALVCCGVAIFGSLSAALILGAFCAGVFFVFDPIVRPLLAGKNIELPYWLMTLAMIAGLQTFGMLGIFICPQIVLLLRHLIATQTGETATSAVSSDPDKP